MLKRLLNLLFSLEEAQEKRSEIEGYYGSIHIPLSHVISFFSNPSRVGCT